MSRTTARDIDAAGFLSDGFPSNFSKVLYDELQKESKDQDGFSTDELLRKDYKEWVINDARVGISAVGMPFKRWIEKEARFDDDVAAYFTAKNLDVLLVMTSFKDEGQFQREMYVVGSDELTEFLIKRMNDEPNGMFVLEPLVVGDRRHENMFAQLNLKASRKLVQPCIADILNSKI